LIPEKAGIMKLRSLFGAIAGGLLLTAALVPRADAFVVSYFNFEDPPIACPACTPSTATWDITPDKTVAAGGDNAGGGIESSTSNLTIIVASGVNTGTQNVGLTQNTAPGDQDVPPAHPILHSIFFNSTSQGNMSISFSVNLQFYAGLSLSFAVNNAGNGYRNVELSWVGASGGPLFNTIPTSTNTTINFGPLPNSLNGDGNLAKVVTFTLTFSNGSSNGNNLQTQIDNIRLDTTTIVPEPTTIAGGLLGVLGLCWHQRRRLIRSVRWRRA
jgi:hypothetical protein